MIKRVILLFTHCSIIILLTGCWDEVDIENRGFVVGVAIDMAESQTEGKYNLSLTTQIINPAGYGTPGQGAGQEKAFTNLTASGESMLAIIRDMASKTGRTPYFEHLKILIVSEEVAKEPNLLASILDFYIRDQEMRRGIKVLISEDKAKSILEVDPKSEKYPVKYIESVINNSIKNMEVIDPVRLGKVHAYLLNEDSYVLPRVLPIGGEMEDKGVAVFQGHNNMMVGTLNGEETKGLNLIKKKNKSGTIKFDIDGQLMVLEIETTKSKIKMTDTKDPGNMSVSIKISVEGGIAEMFGSKSLLDPKYLSKIEGKIAKKVEQLVNQTIEKAQQELKADVFGLHNILKQKHYDTWDKIKNDWDRGENYFTKSNIKVSVSAKVRGIGATDRAKDLGGN